jgi:hypothetical protein
MRMCQGGKRSDEKIGWNWGVLSASRLLRQARVVVVELVEIGRQGGERLRENGREGWWMRMVRE